MGQTLQSTAHVYVLRLSLEKPTPTLSQSPFYFLSQAPWRTAMPNPISIFSQDPEAEVGTASRTGITDVTHALVLFFYSVFFARWMDKKG